MRACPSCLLNQLCVCRCRWQKILFQFLRMTHFIENWGSYIGSICSQHSVIRLWFISGQGTRNISTGFHLESVFLFPMYSQVSNFPFKSHDSSFYVYSYCGCMISLQSCPSLCDPMDCSPPGSSVAGFSVQKYWSGLPCLLQGLNTHCSILAWEIP